MLDVLDGIGGRTPIWVWNSFATGTHSVEPCRPARTWSGRGRRAGLLAQGYPVAN
jgi:hypothetical protein